MNQQQYDNITSRTSYNASYSNKKIIPNKDSHKQDITDKKIKLKQNGFASQDAMITPLEISLSEISKNNSNYCGYRGKGFDGQDKSYGLELSNIEKLYGYLIFDDKKQIKQGCVMVSPYHILTIMRRCRIPRSYCGIQVYMFSDQQDGILFVEDCIELDVDSEYQEDNDNSEYNSNNMCWVILKVQRVKYDRNKEGNGRQRVIVQDSKDKINKDKGDRMKQQQEQQSYSQVYCGLGYEEFFEELNQVQQGQQLKHNWLCGINEQNQNNIYITPIEGQIVESSNSIEIIGQVSNNDTKKEKKNNDGRNQVNVQLLPGSALFSRNSSLKVILKGMTTGEDDSIQSIRFIKFKLSHILLIHMLAYNVYELNLKRIQCQRMKRWIGQIEDITKQDNWKIHKGNADVMVMQGYEYQEIEKKIDKENGKEQQDKLLNMNSYGSCEGNQKNKLNGNIIRNNYNSTGGICSDNYQNAAKNREKLSWKDAVKIVTQSCKQLWIQEGQDNGQNNNNNSQIYRFSSVILFQTLQANTLIPTFNNTSNAVQSNILLSQSSSSPSSQIIAMCVQSPYYGWFGTKSGVLLFVYLRSGITIKRIDLQANITSMIQYRQTLIVSAGDRVVFIEAITGTIIDSVCVNSQVLCIADCFCSGNNNNSINSNNSRLFKGNYRYFIGTRHYLSMITQHGVVALSLQLQDQKNITYVQAICVLQQFKGFNNNGSNYMSNNNNNNNNTMSTTKSYHSQNNQYNSFKSESNTQNNSNVNFSNNASSDIIFLVSSSSMIYMLSLAQNGTNIIHHGTLLGHERNVYFLEQSSYNKSLAISGSSDGMVIQWDLVKQGQLRIIKYSKPIYFGFFVSNEELAIMEYNQVRILSMKDKQLSRKLKFHNKPITCAGRISENAFITCDSENKIAVWKIYQELKGRLKNIAAGVKKWVKSEVEGDGQDDSNGIINVSCCIDEDMEDEVVEDQQKGIIKIDLSSLRKYQSRYQNNYDIYQKKQQEIEKDYDNMQVDNKNNKSSILKIIKQDELEKQIPLSNVSTQGISNNERNTVTVVDDYQDKTMENKDKEIKEDYQIQRIDEVQQTENTINTQSVIVIEDTEQLKQDLKEVILKEIQEEVMNDMKEQMRQNVKIAIKTELDDAMVDVNEMMNMKVQELMREQAERLLLKEQIKKQIEEEEEEQEKQKIQQQNVTDKEQSKQQMNNEIQRFEIAQETVDTTQMINVNTNEMHESSYQSSSLRSSSRQESSQLHQSSINNSKELFNSAEYIKNLVSFQLGNMEQAILSQIPCNDSEQKTNESDEEEQEEEEEGKDEDNKDNAQQQLQVGYQISLKDSQKQEQQDGFTLGQQSHRTTIMECSSEESRGLDNQSNNEIDKINEGDRNYLSYYDKTVQKTNNDRKEYYENELLDNQQTIGQHYDSVPVCQIVHTDQEQCCYQKLQQQQPIDRSSQHNAILRQLFQANQISNEQSNQIFTSQLQDENNDSYLVMQSQNDNHNSNYNTNKNNSTITDRNNNNISQNNATNSHRRNINSSMSNNVNRNSIKDHQSNAIKMTVSQNLCELEPKSNQQNDCDDNNSTYRTANTVIDRLKEMEKVERALHKNDDIIDRLYGFIVEQSQNPKIRGTGRIN